MASLLDGQRTRSTHKVQVTPSFTVYDIPNSGLGDTKFSSQLALVNFGIHTENVPDLFISKFMLWMHLTLGMVSSVFCFSIHSIIFLVSNSQMRWINAIRTISIWTVVKNAKTMRNWAKVKNVTCSVSANNRCSIKPVLLNIPISKPHSGTIPKPTRFGDSHFGKESYWKIKGKSLLCEVFCRNSELIRVTHNNAVHAVGRLLAVAAAFLLSPTTNQKSTP